MIRDMFDIHLALLALDSSEKASHTYFLAALKNKFIIIVLLKKLD
jgi:hypothetical protein